MIILKFKIKHDTSITDNPGEIMQMANEYTAGGFQLVFDMLEEGHSDPIYNISMQLSDLFENVR